MLYSLVLPGVGLPFFVSKRIRTLSVESAAVCGQQSLEMRRWGGVPAPLSQPTHRGSFTNVFKKEESWVKITAWRVLQVSLPLCVLVKKKKKKVTNPPAQKQINSPQSFYLQSKFASNFFIHRNMSTKRLGFLLNLLTQCSRMSKDIFWYYLCQWVKEASAASRHCVCMSGLTRSWNIYRLLVAAMAMMFSDGCQAMCRIFLVKSRLSTPTSPRRRLPPV